MWQVGLGKQCGPRAVWSRSTLCVTDRSLKQCWPRAVSSESTLFVTDRAGQTVSTQSILIRVHTVWQISLEQSDPGLHYVWQIVLGKQCWCRAVWTGSTLCVTDRFGQTVLMQSIWSGSTLCMTDRPAQAVSSQSNLIRVYSVCDRWACINSVNLEQTDQGLHCVWHVCLGKKCWPGAVWSGSTLCVTDRSGQTVSTESSLTRVYIVRDR